VLGVVSAVLILTGVLPTLQVPGIDLNFAGYVLWSLWLLVFAVLILRHARRGAGSGPVRPAGAGRGGTQRTDQTLSR
jgi:hypothetical protein